MRDITNLTYVILHKRASKYVGGNTERTAMRNRFIITEETIILPSQ